MVPLYKKLLNGQDNVIFKICQENFKHTPYLIDIGIGVKC
jgi:hypothetical protein